MAYIVIYDATETDRQQLGALLATTDHHWEFVADPISTTNTRPEAEMISVFVTSNVTADVLVTMPKLRMIACRSTGFNNIDLSVTASRSIVVTNVPTYGEETVAEYAFTLLLALTRKLLPAITAVQTSHIVLTDLTGFDLAGKTLGLLGAGHIGQNVARIANGFRMNVIAYDPFPNQQRAEQFGFSYKPLDEVLAESHVVSVHVPYLPSNHHLVNGELLSKFRDGAILINTARGELIETKALIAALEAGKLSGVALDVLEGEKLLNLQEEKLLLQGEGGTNDTMLEQSMELRVLSRMPNVIITPHNAFNTVEAIGRINDSTALSLTRFWYGETPYKVVPPPPKHGKLVIARHAESEWNAKGIWSGSRDIHLSEKGFRAAALFGRTIKDIPIDFAFTSEQIRAFETMEAMLDAKQQFDVPYERSGALNERDYGDYTGKNKWEVQQQIGETEFEKLRRGWDYPVKNGESLKQVYERSVPYYLEAILARVLSGQNVLIVAHGNSIRSLIKYIENIDDEAIADVEMLYGSILLYDLDDQGHCAKKTVRQANVQSPKM